MTTTDGSGPNREVEYAQTIGYIQHMYTTRHEIFKFAVALNTALLGIVLQFLHTSKAQLALGLLGGAVTLSITLMARRSWRFLAVLEDYAMELEKHLGFGLIRETTARMPKGIVSTAYLFVVYWAFVGMWLVFCACFLLQSLGICALIS